MDSIGFTTVLDILGKFGTVGLILFMWWYDSKYMREQAAQHKKDLETVLAQYKQDMSEQRKMYENNVKLCESFASISKDLRDIVILNTQQITTMAGEIRQNEYCPMIRVKKEQILQKSGY